MSETAAKRSIPEPRRPGLPATGRPVSAHIRGAMIASFTAMFTATIAMVAPAALNGDIQSQLHASGSQLSWVTAIFFIPTAALELTFGVVGDLLGRKRLLVAGSVVFGRGFTGLMVGMLAGYAGGWFDRFVNLLLINAFLSFPGILLAIAFAAFLGPGISKVILALVITGWAGYARLARAQVLKVKELEFILAAKSLGASHARVLATHLLPNILQPVLIQATIGMAGAILAESTLSFLGLGVLAPVPSWGAMLNDARSHLFDAPHLVIFPALAVVLAVLAFNLLGDAWRDWLDPRTRSQMAVMDLTR